MIQGCEQRCWLRCRPSMRAAWWFVRPAVGTPSAGSKSLVYQLGVPSPPVGLLVPVPLWPPAPWTGARDLQAAPPPQVAPGGRWKRGDTGCVVPTGRLSQTPRSVRELLAGPRRPAPRPTARRGAPVPRCHCHRYHHSNNNSNSCGRPASKVAGRYRAPSKCIPFFHECSYHADGS
jgi:hypothetical protein